jgi:hypothetical protein
LPPMKLIDKGRESLQECSGISTVSPGAYMIACREVKEKRRCRITASLPKNSIAKYGCTFNREMRESRFHILEILEAVTTVLVALLYIFSGPWGGGVERCVLMLVRDEAQDLKYGTQGRADIIGSALCVIFFRFSGVRGIRTPGSLRYS